MSQQNHRVILEDRNRMEIEGGVLHVHNYDSQRITLETIHGFMDLMGEQLNIEELNLEKGSMSVSGVISSFAYSEEKGAKKKGKNLIKKMLR